LFDLNDRYQRELGGATDNELLTAVRQRVLDLDLFFVNRSQGYVLENGRLVTTDGGGGQPLRPTRGDPKPR